MSASDLGILDDRVDLRLKEALGYFTIRTPKSNQLFVDIDSEESVDTLNTAIAKLERNLGWDIQVDIQESKSGHPHYHAVVDLPVVLDNYQRIALQACLGSDRTRELLAFSRSFLRIQDPILFMEAV